MMYRISRYLIAFQLMLAGLCFPTTTNAGIAVSLVDFRMDSTQVSIGYTLTISAQVQNTDSVLPFSGVLDFGLRNTNTDLSNLSIFNKPPYSGNQVTLNPREIVPAVFSIRIGDPYFTPGPDVVVVWPKSSTSAIDSILIYLTIENPNGLAENQSPDFSYLILKDRILLRYESQELNFKQVRILNIMGQQLSFRQGDLITEIPLPALPSGIYLCEMITAEKKVRIIKFFH